jgi:hypothetical protein
LIEVLKAILLADACQFELTIRLRNEIGERRLRREERFGALRAHGKDRARLVCVRLNHNGFLAIGLALFCLNLNHTLSRAAGHYSNAITARSIERGDALGIALLNRKDDKLLNPVNEIIGFLAALEIADRTEGELIPSRVNTGEQCRQTADRGMFNLDAEELTDCFRQIVASVVTLTLVSHVRPFPG